MIKHKQVFKITDQLSNILLDLGFLHCCVQVINATQRVF